MHKTICLLALIGHVLAVVPSLKERADIIEQFTSIREDVTPTASNMTLLTYSAKMEKLAKTWVARCVRWYPTLSKYPEFDGTGMLRQNSFNATQRFENLAFLGRQAKDYNYENNTCGNHCRSYKLIVWAAATEVGCAKAKCYHEPSLRDIYFLACVFNHVYDDLRGRPYEEGEVCSKCPQRIRMSTKSVLQNPTASW
uniref:SCP domain-containing protein n=1 Tax=Mesocestoides corti TaxID=53468 RepID=A0A5K3FTF2_MESCO